MKHRKLLWVPLVVLLPLVLAGCLWQGPAAPGSIAFALSAKALGKEIDPTADTVRVYLMSGGSLYPITSKGYDEATITSSGATYTSPQVPAGNYSLMLAVGKKDAAGFLVTKDYASPVSITVSPGVNTPITVTLQPSPFTNTALWDNNVTGAVVVNSTPYVATQASLYQIGIGVGGAVTVPNSPTATVSAGSINSLSAGPDLSGNTNNVVPWLNTTQGIVPFVGGLLNTNFASGAGVQNVLDSIAAIGTPPNYVAVYERSAGVGGAAVAGGTTVGAWFDVDLSQFLSGKPFLDVLRSPSNQDLAYFATSLGAFRMDGTIIGQSNTTAQVVLNSAVFVKVLDTSGNEIPILSLAILNGKLLMGTKNGLYTATLSEGSATEAISDAPVLVSGTEGNAITRIRTALYNNNGQQSEVALLSDSNVFLWDGVNAPTAFPFYSGLPADLPGQVNAIEFYVSSGTGPVYLMLAGAKGLVIYDTGLTNHSLPS